MILGGNSQANRRPNVSGAKPLPLAFWHPNIVSIHEIGMHDGRHLFSMDYVEGQNLEQRVSHRPLAAAKAARYVKLIAEAIHYAHQQGILRRDLKPSNVLIDAATDQSRGQTLTWPNAFLPILNLLKYLSPARCSAHLTTSLLNKSVAYRGRFWHSANPSRHSRDLFRL